jgi:hypothetical protein
MIPPYSLYTLPLYVACDRFTLTVIHTHTNTRICFRVFTRAYNIRLGLADGYRRLLCVFVCILQCNSMQMRVD